MEYQSSNKPDSTRARGQKIDFATVVPVTAYEVPEPRK
jgi:hypothetical protein